MRIKFLIHKAKEDFAKGEYQWVAQITNTLVFADPENMDARYLCADALEQLGYQAESGPWRSAYLCAAQELRNGTNTDDATRNKGNGDVVSHMTPDMILDYLGILVDTTKVPDLSFTANIILPEGNLAGYGNRIRVKYTAKWGVQIVRMIFQTHSNTHLLVISIA